MKSSKVALGARVYFDVKGVKPNWSGWARVNNTRSVPLDAQHPYIDATEENAFAVQPKNELTLTLVNAKGLAIALQNKAPMSVEVFRPQVVLHPETDSVGPVGGSGNLEITAAKDYKWKLGSVPDWIQFPAGTDGQGPDKVEYVASPNSTNKSRVARITIGDAVFEVTQPAAAAANTQKKTDGPVAQASGKGMARITLDSDRVSNGGEFHLVIDQVQNDWRGEVTVNSLRHFPLDKKDFRLKAAESNGFKVGEASEIYILLTDSRGRQIPATNGGRFRVMVTQVAVTLEAESRNIGPDGGAGSIHVTAPPKYKWLVKDVPQWVSIDAAKTGPDKGMLSYVVSPNVSNEGRSATLTVGDAVFQLTQARSRITQIPFRDSFQFMAPPPALWDLMPKGGTVAADSPVRWTWDQQAGHDTKLGLTRESPAKGSSLLISRLTPDSRDWAMQLYLPHINFSPGVQYKISLMMKAENPGPVAVLVGQSTKPFKGCGLYSFFNVTREWKKFETNFQINGQHCEAMNNRLDIQAGKLRGKLWITELSLDNVK